MNSILELFKEWGGHILSGLGIVGGLWAYFRHDMKIKHQEKVLNDLQIKQIEKTEAKERMAEIKCNIIHERGTARIRIVNSGQADARNVRVEVITSEQDREKIEFFDSFTEPYDLINPQSYREERVFLYEGCPNNLKLQITWDDDFAQNRTCTLVSPL